MEPFQISPPQTWYIVFSDTGRRRYPWQFICKEGFTHLAMMGAVGDNMTIIVEHLASRIGIQVLNKSVDQVILDLAPGATAILSHTTDFRADKYWTPRGLITCVGVAKAILDIRHFKGVTPFALYRYLIKKQSANIIKPYSPFI